MRAAIELVVGPDEEGARLERLVLEEMARRSDGGFSRADIRRLFEAGAVKLVRGEGSRVARKGERAVTGDRLSWTAPEAVVAEPEGALAVVLATTHWVVVDKPAGQPSAPIRAGERGTAAGALLGRYPEMAAVGYRRREPGLVHRLDRETSGLLWAARSSDAFDAARGALSAGDVDKRYLLICSASIDDEGVVDRPISTEGPTVRLDPAGRPAVTRYRVLQRRRDRALVEASASPAVRHQVRVHFASLGAPLLGDVRYGGDPALTGRHARHASRIAWAGDGRFEGFAVDLPLPASLGQWLG